MKIPLANINILDDPILKDQMNPRKTLSGETVIWADCLPKKSILAISGPNIDRENFSREYWISTRPDGLDGGLEKIIRPRFCKMGT